GQDHPAQVPPARLLRLAGGQVLVDFERAGGVSIYMVQLRKLTKRIEVAGPRAFLERLDLLDKCRGRVLQVDQGQRHTHVAHREEDGHRHGDRNDTQKSYLPAVQATACLAASGWPLASGCWIGFAS